MSLVCHRIFEWRKLGSVPTGHLLGVVELKVRMNFFECLIDLLQLGSVHIRADSAVAEMDRLVFDPSTKVNPHLQLRLFVTGES